MPHTSEVKASASASSSPTYRDRPRSRGHEMFLVNNLL